jgi:DNA-binding XRE family transcriptional regulator
MLQKLNDVMKKQRYSCPLLGNDAKLTRHAVYKIVKGHREARVSEAIAIAKTLNLKINSIDDLKDFFCPDMR